MIEIGQVTIVASGSIMASPLATIENPVRDEKRREETRRGYVVSIYLFSVDAPA